MLHYDCTAPYYREKVHLPKAISRISGINDDSNIPFKMSYCLHWDDTDSDFLFVQKLSGKDKVIKPVDEDIRTSLYCRSRSHICHRHVSFQANIVGRSSANLENFITDDKRKSLRLWIWNV